ncbi:hypothetical protein Gpo141_00011885 [Globisporangium polare]
MALYEQLHLKAILPALTTSDGLTLEEQELLQSILADCELDDLLLLTGDSSSSSSSSDQGGPVDSPDARAAKRQRKRTYEQRKDEIDALEKKAQLLSATLDFLKHRAGVQDDQSIAQQELNNSMLRELLRSQQFLVAGFRSMMATNESEYDLSPVSTWIHLESAASKRRQLLKSLKYQKIHDARRFLEKRTQFSPKTTRFSESSRRRTDDGGTVAEKFDIVPLLSARSIKQVYDALAFYFANLEICMTETLGDVVLREESTESAAVRDKEDASIAQHRFLYNHRDIRVETNSLVFSEYKQNHKSALTGEFCEEGIFATDFVDQDDLYPYAPHERVRKDIVSVFHIQSVEKVHESSRSNASSLSLELSDEDKGDSNLPEDDDPEQVVVLTMWFQSKLRRCELDVSEDRILELVEDTDRVHEAILKSVRATLRCVARED